VGKANNGFTQRRDIDIRDIYSYIGLLLGWRAASRALASSWTRSCGHGRTRGLTQIRDIYIGSVCGSRSIGLAMGRTLSIGIYML